MQRRAGFTLLEVMLVMVLIGILVSTVVLTFNTDSAQDRLQKEATRFQQVFQFIAETAQLRQQEWGLVVNANSYAFVYYSAEGWQWVEEPVAAKQYQLPELISLQLLRDGLPGEETNLLSQLEFSTASEDTPETEAVKPPLPTVFILSSGEISPFRLILQIREQGEEHRLALGTDFSLPLNRYDMDTL